MPGAPCWPPQTDSAAAVGVGDWKRSCPAHLVHFPLASPKREKLCPPADFLPPRCVLLDGDKLDLP